MAKGKQFQYCLEVQTWRSWRKFWLQFLRLSFEAVLHVASRVSSDIPWHPTCVTSLPVEQHGSMTCCRSDVNFDTNAFRHSASQTHLEAAIYIEVTFFTCPIFALFFPNIPMLSALKRQRSEIRIFVSDRSPVDSTGGEPHSIWQRSVEMRGAFGLAGRAQGRRWILGLTAKRKTILGSSERRTGDTMIWPQIGCEVWEGSRFQSILQAQDGQAASQCRGAGKRDIWATIVFWTLEFLGKSQQILCAHDAHFVCYSFVVSLWLDQIHSFLAHAAWPAVSLRMLLEHLDVQIL